MKQKAARRKGFTEEQFELMNDEMKSLMMQHKREFWEWFFMNERCNNPENPDYPKEGGRGIKVCYEWLAPWYGGPPDAFQNFMNSVGPMPKD